MNKKDQIINSVIKKFKDEGFSSDLTITQIAKSVNIGKSTIYEYFKSKDDVIKEALLAMSVNNTKRIFDIENIENMKFEEAFKAQLVILFHIASESRMMFEVFSKDFKNQLPSGIQAELMETMTKSKENIEKRFIDIMIKGVSEGLISMDKNPLDVNVMSGLIIGSMIRYSSNDVELDLIEFVDKVYEAVLKLG